MLWLRLSKLLPWLVLATGLAITWQFWEHARQEAVQEMQTQFIIFAHETDEIIEQRMKTYEQVLRGAQGFFAVDDKRRREDFHTYVATLRLTENHPGIQGMSFAPVVPQAQKDKFIAAIRKQGFPTYSIQPKGQRDIYAPVIYIEPFSSRNLRALGTDNYAEPSRRNAIERARDIGRAAITEKITLAQETDKNRQAGFLMFQPVYRSGAPIDTLADRRANISGWVAAAFRMDDLMRGIYGEHTTLIDIEIYDGKEMSDRTLMHDSDGNPGSRRNPRFQNIKQLEIAGHPWTVAIYSLPKFDAQLTGWPQQFIAIAGFGSSLLLALLTWLLATGRERAIKAAQVMSRELIESEARSREITSTLGEGVYVLDRQMRITFTNPELQKILGWTEAELLGQHSHTLFHHNRADGTHYPEELCEIGMVMRTGQALRSDQEVFWRKDGRMLHVSVNSMPIIREGEVTGAVVTFQDITERKQSEQALVNESKKHETLLKTASDGIQILDIEGKLIQVNDSFCRMLDYPKEQLLSMNITQVDAQLKIEEIKVKIAELLKSDQPQTFETRLRRRDGTTIDVEVNANAVEIDGKPLIYASARDITKRKASEEYVQHLAHYDALTDLPNRARFNDRMHQALAQARRDKAKLAVIFLDLDMFKPVNDTHGHDIGDLLLKEVAKRLQECVQRETDMVSRIGGDEFVLLLSHITEESDALAVAEKILHALNQPFRIRRHKIGISSSLGIAIYPQHGEEPVLLIKNADIAMYHAKESGRSNVKFYQADSRDSPH